MTEAETQELKRLIIKTIDERKPTTLKELIGWLEKETAIPENRLFSLIQELEEDKNLRFYDLFFPESARHFAFSARASWYWIVLFLSLLALFFAYAIPEAFFPQEYIRAVFGLIFVLYLPGYVIVKILFPVKLPLETNSVILDTIERSVFSLALSLVVTPIMGLVLYYTPLGIGFLPITSALFFVIILLANVGVVREYNARKSLFLNKIVPISGYELSGDKLTFFDEVGFLRKRRVVVREIPILEITNVVCFEDKLSITWSDITNLFFIRYNSDLFSELIVKLGVKDSV